ncbi:MAG: tRNA 2-selenouridine(34) synthase MnmH [Planctomycetota bacterium]
MSVHRPVDLELTTIARDTWRKLISLSATIHLNSTPSHSIPLVPPETFWQLSADRPIVDVRSPAEYLQGHVPGAFNVPLFSNEERAEIGTVYKNSGRDDAMLRGLNLVGPRMGEFSSRAKRICSEHSSSKDVLVHCWRGGLRSESMAWLFKITGLAPIVLEGGYKAFRRHAQSRFEEDWPLVVVSGLTGAGKTDVLDELKSLGEQVVELEQLANHRGSAFGSIGQPDQPTTEQFENQLFVQLDRCDRDQTVWVEDEGNRLGTVVVPPTFVAKIRRSPAIFIDSSPSDRVRRLLKDYGSFSPAQLIESIANIRKRLGPQHADEATRLVADGNVERAIQIVLDYYDRTYLHAAAKMERPKMHQLDSSGLTAREVAQRMVELKTTVSSATQ